MTPPELQAISPYFIVSDVEQTMAFYRDKLDFETRLLAPNRGPFFAIIGRDRAQIFVKSDKNVSPLPNPSRHPYMRWDAFVYVPDPDALAAEFAQTARPSAYRLSTPMTVSAASRFGIPTATSCSSDGQGRINRTAAILTVFYPEPNSRIIPLGLRSGCRKRPPLPKSLATASPARYPLRAAPSIVDGQPVAVQSPAR
jgi:hypothetical protein